MPEAALNARIDVLLTELKLPTARKTYERVVDQVTKAGGGYLAFLHAILEEEVTERRTKRISRRMKEARFRQVKLLSELDSKSLPKEISLERIQELASGTYLEQAYNVIAIGNSGTGKTHLCTGLAVQACQAGKRVRFYTATELASELEEAQEQHQLHRYLKRFAALDLAVVDELGYLPLTTRGAELLFQAFSERNERGSIVVNTNLPFNEWTQVFHTEKLTVALLDRLTHRAHILEMNGESYRMKSALKQKGRA